MVEHAVDLDVICLITLYHEDDEVKRLALEVIRCLCIDKTKGKQVLDHGFLQSVSTMLKEDDDISDAII